MKQVEKFQYDNTIVRNFAYASITFAVIGMLVGLLVAYAFIWPEISFGVPYLTFGRLRPLHTNAVVFAFVGNAIFAGVYYSTQRLAKARMFSKALSNFHFWGWQTIILAAAITLPMGFTSSHEYAELEWPIDLAIAVVWITFGINLLMTLVRRREEHLYVAIWFYIATWVTITVLHVGNNLELPFSAFKSYPVFAGVQDALIQWWYGHNAVAFFLTTPYLGMMYYFVPKAANRPVYSYKLSILHFWGLIFIYIWAGPHHLLYSALPDWVQTLGTIFSLMLIAPSWGGMINGLLTLRGAWDKVRQDPVLKFFVVAITAYGMATLEGPLMSLKTVNSISHFTDWTIGHVHVAALGWNGMLTFGMFYWMFPRMYKTKLYSVKLANWHFWISTMGIMFYAIPMYWTGITQSLMWKQFTPEGNLVYSNFLDTVTQLIPMYSLRAFGGTLYYVGLFLLIYNLAKTIGAGSFVADEDAEAPARSVSTGGVGHRILERKPNLMHIMVFVAIFVGGFVEIIPMVLVEENIPKISSVTPYSPLELAGRDIYIREGCVGCHSQMVRPFRSETARYGDYSKSGEYIYDRPFLFGSKRTGPDLMREGVLRPSATWHYNHMNDPRSTSPGSIMPVYSWLLKNDLYYGDIQAKLRALKTLGTPYNDQYISEAEARLEAQAKKIGDELRKDGIKDDAGDLDKKEIIAIIAYMKKLGTGLTASK